MAHCGRGDGASDFDMLEALEQWVEHKQPPAQVLASRKRDNKVDRTRPLCPFPQVSRYKGAGNPNDASSFTCMNF
jgi:feruloyl esterase